jgi:hypothetical protein
VIEKTKSNQVKLGFKALFKVKQRQSDIPDMFGMLNLEGTEANMLMEHYLTNH